MREVFGSIDLCSVLGVIAALHVAGRLVEKYQAASKERARFVGVLAALGVGAGAFVWLAPHNSGGVLASILAGCLAGEVATIAAALVLPVVHGLRTRAARRTEQATSRAHDARRREQAADELRRRERERAEAQPLLERARAEADARAAAEAESRRRRDDLRWDCVAHYQLHAVDIAARFPRKKFDEYVRTRLTDEVPLDELERRAGQLRALIDGHREKAGPGRPHAVAALGAWYAASRAEVQALDAPENVKTYQLRRLERRYVELVQKAMEEAQP